MTNSKWEELAREFYQYMSKGYAGGEGGCRCSECDAKYSGDGAFYQLCPLCKAREVIATTTKQAVEKNDKKWRERIKKIYTQKFNDFRSRVETMESWDFYTTSGETLALQDLLKEESTTQAKGEGGV